MQNIDSETWDAEWKDIFFGDPKLLEIKRERAKRLKPTTGEGGRGSLVGFDTSKQKKVTSLDEMAKMSGRMSGLSPAKRGDTSKPLDAGKNQLRPSITPNDDGTLDLDLD